MTQENEASIRFENVCYKVDQTPIINNLTGEIYKGKITTLIGPSGAGKTTLLKMCNGLISPTAGEITINGKNINTISPTKLRRNVGIALQSAPIIRGTVYENLSLARTLHNETLSEKEAISFLEDAGLNRSFLNRQVADLSGGQRQKISIARTLINRSHILLLDEITSALDPTSVHEIEQLILKINEKYESTIIWITHNIQQAKEIGDYTWFMMDGQLIESGKSNVLLDSSNLHIQEFVQGALEK